MSQPKFSVVVPTRFGHATLPATLSTCVDQDFDDYDIVVVDNASLPETRKVVESFASDRVRYFRHDEPLAMTENWNRALSYARGEWITFLGDDDALMPGALRKLDSAIKRHSVRSIRWSPAMYTWPDHLDPEHANKLSVPLMAGETIVATKDRLAAMATGMCSPNVPSIYYGLIHRSLVEDALVTGPVFEGRIPDYYSATLFGALTTEFLEMREPLAIAGLSGKANGMAHLAPGDANATRRDFEQLNTAHSLEFHAEVPDANMTCVYVWDAVFRVRDRLALNDPNYWVPPEQVAQVCMANIAASEPERSAQIAAVKLFVAAVGTAEPAIPICVESGDGQFSCEYLPDSGELGFHGEYLTLDVSDPAINDVADAARFAACILRSAPALDNVRLEAADREKLIAAQTADLAAAHRYTHELAQTLATRTDAFDDESRRLRRCQAKCAAAEAELREIRRSSTWRAAQAAARVVRPVRRRLGGG